MRVKARKKVFYKHFELRYSGWGGEYKSVCHRGDYESEYGSRTKAAKSAIKHVTDVHGVDGSEER